MAVATRSEYSTRTATHAATTLKPPCERFLHFLWMMPHKKTTLQNQVEHHHG